MKNKLKTTKLNLIKENTANKELISFYQYLIPQPKYFFNPNDDFWKERVNNA